MPGPLSGIRVLDVGHAMVGPWSAMLLGAMGAEVIKVDTPRGDIGHNAPPKQGGVSVVYLHPNFNKKSTIYDLKDEGDRAVVHRLAAASDVLVENMRPGTTERLGLGYDEVSRLNPSIVYCSASAWGREGPMASLGGVDPTVQAFCGLPSITGAVGATRPELYRYFAHIDANTSCYIAAAILEGLFLRERTGRGLKIDVTMLGAAINLQATRVAEYFATGEKPLPLGSASATTAPHRAFRCGDARYLAVGVERDDQWGRFCEAAGLPELAADPRFRTNPDRVRHRAELDALLEPHFLAKPQRYWVITLERAGIPCGPFLDFEALKCHAQVLENRYIVDLDTVHYGRMYVGGIPWAFAGTPAKMRRGGSPGEHTAEVTEATTSMSPVTPPAGGEASLSAALSGIRVVELSQGIAGPYCGMLLAAAGAGVVKVEPPGGDYYRQAGPPFAGADGAGFAMINQGKRSVVLEPGDQEALERLVAEADVVIEDSAKESPARPGVGYDGVRARNPEVIYCDISGFGERGPLAGKPCSELVAQAMAECWASLGDIGEPPERWGGDVASIETGVFAYQGVLAALLHRMRSGRGQKVSVSLFGSLLHMRGVMWAAITNPDEWFGLHCDSFTRGRDHGYQTGDGAVYFSMRQATEEDYVRLLSDLDMLDVLDDPRFGEGGRDAVGLGRFAPEVKPRWERAYARFTTEDVVSLIRRHNGEAVPINDYDTLFAHPQVQALDLVEDRPASEGGLPRLLRVPWRFSWGQEWAVRPSPALGEHTPSVLQRAREAGGR